MKLIFLTILLNFLLNVAVMADTTCGTIEWTEPAQVLGGKFEGKMTQRCLLSTTGELTSFHDYLLQTLDADLVSWHQRATAASLDSLRGLNHELTIRTNDGQLRQVVFIGENYNTVLYQAESVAINFSGMARHLEYLFIKFKVKEIRAGKYEIVLENKIRVNKPRMAPARMFLNISVRNSLKQFRSSMEDLIEDIKNQI